MTEIALIVLDKNGNEHEQIGRLAVETVPRKGEHVYLEENVDQPGAYEVELVRHNYYKLQGQWSNDQPVELFIRYLQRER